MSVVTTGNIPKLLWPGLNALWGREYDEYTPEWRDLFDTKTSDMNYEEDVELTGFGLAPVKQQGAAITYDTFQQQNVTRYTHVAYGLGFIVTREEMDDNLYEKKATTNTAALAWSFRQTKENVGANVYNRGFNSSFQPTGDGQPLFSASHPTMAGNQSNLLAAADLSEAALEDACIQIMGAQNARGLIIKLMPESLHIPRQLVFEAERIMKSILTPDSGNNAINALRSTGMFPKGAAVNHFFTDSDAYFIRTNVPVAGMTMFQRTKAEFAQDGDFDTSNLKYKGYERFSFGASDFRAVYGAAGA
jgi:hypothetical protein